MSAYPEGFLEAQHAALTPRRRPPIETWGVKCAQAECDYYVADESDLALCETCNRGFCAACLVVFGGVKYCPDCAKCDHCRATPVVSCCEECGELLCAVHARTVEDYDPDLGYRHTALMCAPRCRPLAGFEKADDRENQSTQQECPF